MTNVMGERVSTTVLILQAIGLVAPSPYTGMPDSLSPMLDIMLTASRASRLPTAML